MKGDFSRFTFDPRKHYSSVLQQQGRVQLDADWNEQAEIEARRARLLALDLIGPAGAPQGDAGFEISPLSDGDLGISAGRMYVGGVLCELPEPTTYLTQPHLGGVRPASPAAGNYLVYLDVWDRHVTAVEDPSIREVALGGSDTATRAQTVWQVKVRAGGDDWPPPAGAGRLAASVTYTGLEAALYRIEIHDGGDAGGATFKWARDNGSTVFAVSELVAAGGKTKAVVRPVGRARGTFLRAGDWVELVGDESELSLMPGSIVRVAKADARLRLVWLDGDVTDHRRETHLKLRRWHQDGAALRVTHGPIELEQGVVVEFAGGPFRTGDYWAIPARAGEGSVEWPSEPPRGIHHDHCKLAVVTWRKRGRNGWAGTVADRRRLFAPLAREG